MSKIKKIAGLLLAVVMVVAMSTVAWADAPYTITIDNDADGYVYTAYQIFAGTLHEEYTQYTGTTEPTDGTLLYTEDGGVYTLFTGSFDPTATYYYVSSTTLSNITWGSGIDSDNTTLQSALTTAYGTTDAAEIAKKLTSTEAAKEFASIIDDYLTTGTDSSDTGDTYTIEVSDAGYYLIKNTTVPNGGSYTSYILEVVTNVEVDPKTSDTTIDKTVDDVNDSTGATSTGDSADYDIGDDVPFTLTATLPSNYADYTTYKMYFHDTLSNGLSFNDNSVEVAVYIPSLGSEIGSWTTGTTYYTYDSTTGAFIEVDQTAVTTPVATDTYYVKSIVGSSYYAVATATSGTRSDSTCTFEVQIANTKELYDSSSNKINVTADSKIVVSYTAKLLTTASYMETNEVYVTFSNNPNETGEGTTEKSKTTVFTFTLTVNKVDSSGAALSGAGFTLYKEVVVAESEFDPAATTYYVVGTDGKLGAVDSSAQYDSSAKYYIAVGTQQTGGTSFTWNGLDDGNYVLVETTTPNGYNTMDDLYFSIEAVHTATEITSLTIKDADGNTISGTGETFTTTPSTGAISTKITNYKGSELPSTGGIGTTIFYVVGSILVVGAAVILITRKRMKSAR